jgi:hypothetical protein
MLTVDLLHEFELGLWKDFLTHLVRILESLGPDSVRAFNERYGHPTSSINFTDSHSH